MAGNLTTVTAAIARTALPTVPKLQNGGARLTASTGNPASTGGQALPLQPAAQPVPQVDFSQVVQQLDAFVEGGQRSLQFRVDDVTGDTVMTVVDANTQEVIRQIPPDFKLVLAQSLNRLQGLIVDARV